MSAESFPFGPHARPVLERRYLARDAQGRVSETPEQMLRRVADAVARAEEPFGGASACRDMRRAFTSLMADGHFLPNSPTLMNAGRPLGQLSACFVLPVEDSLESIFQAVKETALIHKSGGGTGFSFSRLRPAGDVVATTHGISSGPLSFMQVFDMATEAVKQGGARRGANMGLLAASHPDIEQFIVAKRTPGRLENFNISVMATDAFMAAARSGAGWDLINPRDGSVVRSVEAAELLERIVGAAHASGEPGLAFYEAINRGNPTPALGDLEATNPCGEQPLLPHESCNLGSLVLPRFLRGGQVDYPALEDAAALAVRFLDNVVTINRHPLPAVTKASQATRKIGLGVMGLADLLVDLGLPYGSPQAVRLGSEIMARISGAARRASAELGQLRGSFPAFKASRLAGEHQHMRNATVTTVAPTGTLSLLMGCSSGIEPYFALAYTRRVLEGEQLVEYNPRFMARLTSLGLDSPENLAALAGQGKAGAVSGLPPETAALFPTAHQVLPKEHLAMQAAFQKHTDNGVSKTVNLPASAGPDAVKEVFVSAHGLGLKGVTVFRSGSRGRQVLELLPLPGQDPPPRVHLSGHCPRCGGLLKTDGGCLACSFCGASGCE
ncbi:MAG: adenosylcobalamin-dependent ribonucleoside-diphosphate reductase [Desulfarculaceae bacterium]|nr:adenosylcobalamin-dependent ribonucleoside-diphosphate reductase [Desulfarculaceae bacterium]MCF8074101.1 adenosylcobalamin-dependent ribonucleoside-diphosphate reductase [Desulfarculaceae bacterium]MCF8103776.1 adenosylcobalamin-dependent ribonucleoside-diphosphate reductase [Desulfarculaceae bacterium]MCF8116835.1 adenosylcobalamin-dependent ribonucleoside-diphosphate reductase [Desulfarculaceae bacterium]